MNEWKNEWMIDSFGSFNILRNAWVGVTNIKLAITEINLIKNNLKEEWTRWHWSDYLPYTTSNNHKFTLLYNINWWQILTFRSNSTLEPSGVPRETELFPGETELFTVSVAVLLKFWANEIWPKWNYFDGGMFNCVQVIWLGLYNTNRIKCRQISHVQGEIFRRNFHAKVSSKSFKLSCQNFGKLSRVSFVTATLFSVL